MAIKRRMNRACRDCDYLLINVSWSDDEPEPVCPKCGGPTEYRRLSVFTKVDVFDESDGPRRAPGIVGLSEIDYNGKRLPIAEVDRKVNAFNQRMIDEGKPHLVARVDHDPTSTRADEIRHTQIDYQKSIGVDDAVKKAHQEAVSNAIQSAMTAAVANNQNPAKAAAEAAKAIGSQAAFAAGK